MSDIITTDGFLDIFEKHRDRVWVFLDTETLGFNPNKHQLTEIAAKAVKLRGDKFTELGSYHEKSKLLSVTRLRLSQPYQGKGLSYRDLMKMTNYGEPIKNRQYLEEELVLNGLLDFLGNYEDPLLVAHNSSFDLRYLNTRQNLYIDRDDPTIDISPYDEYEVLDTLRVMRKYFPAFVATEAKKYKHRWLTEEESQHILRMRKIRKGLQSKKTGKISLKLGRVAHSLGLNVDGWHTAKFDVEALIYVVEEVLSLFRVNAGKELRPEKYYL